MSELPQTRAALPSKALTIAALALPPTVVASLSVVSPHIRLSPGAVDLLTFAGACLTALSAIALLSRAPAIGSSRIVLAAAAALSVGVVALSRSMSLLAVTVVAAALVAFAHVIGDFIGSHIEHPGHILPACVVAACIDLTSVLHPSGPTHAVISSPRALALLAVSFPVMGTTQHAPVIGIGDLLFVSLLLGVARSHRVVWWKVALAAFAGVALAGLASALLEAAVPALPAIGATTLLGVREMRTLRPKDRKVAWMFMAGAVAFSAVALASRFLFLPGR